MLERSNIDGSKVIVDTLKMRESDYGMNGNVGDNESSDDQDMEGVIF